MRDNVSVEQKEAGLMQMKINTRLTALQAAQSLMSTPGYLGVAGEKQVEGTQSALARTPCWIHQPGAVDHVTLLAIAGDIEKYIIGDLEDEAKAAIAAAKNPPPRVIRPV